VAKYFDYLVKSRTLEDGTSRESNPVRGFPVSALAGLEDAGEWMQLADRLWSSRREEEGVSVGVFPCPHADDDGAFVASLGLLFREVVAADTLLIDLDVDHAALGRNLRTPAGPGWGELLASEPAMRLDCVHESEWRGVYVMPVGVVPAEYRAGEFERRLRWLHAIMRRDFRAVVTRFPRASSSRLARACCRIPEVAVLAARPGACRASEVKREARALRGAGANLVGVILTRPEDAAE
jgi:Mrp family chromosome partitioning ATPase